MCLNRVNCLGRFGWPQDLSKLISIINAPSMLATFFFPPPTTKYVFFDLCSFVKFPCWVFNAEYLNSLTVVLMNLWIMALHSALVGQNLTKQILRSPTERLVRPSLKAKHLALQWGVRPISRWLRSAFVSIQTCMCFARFTSACNMLLNGASRGGVCCVGSAWVMTLLA